MSASGSSKSMAMVGPAEMRRERSNFMMDVLVCGWGEWCNMENVMMWLW